ncbi:MAG: FtsQ-type POTRA domain-containing protein [Propionibacteriaceae bacterium]
MTASSTLDRSRSVTPAPGQPPRRRRRWLRVLIVLAVLIALAAAGWLVGFSSVLATRQVNVVGAGTLTPAEVRAAAQVPLGLPLIRQDLDGAAARVATLKPVRVANVKRQWPHSIIVTVQERSPTLAIRQPDGFLLVDAEGVGYLTVSSLPKGVVLASADPTNVPLLTELSVVATALSPELKSKVDKVQAYTADSVRLSLKDGDTVIWGGAEQSDLKADVLKALLKQSARTYDVSAPYNPSIR